MINQDGLFSVLALNEEVRQHILDMLKKNEYPTVGFANLDDLINSLKGQKNALIFVDSEAVMAYGAWIVSRIKTACRECRLILFCSLAHRSLVRRVMELGAYGCIVEPYPEWEFLTMIRPILADLQIDKKTKVSKAKRLDKKSVSD